MKQGRLKNLFAEWEEKHSGQPFVPDGLLSDNEEIKILFICRESNVSDDERKDYFWMADVISKRQEGKGMYTNPNLTRAQKMSETKYFSCLDEIRGEIAKKKKTEIKLENCAYMNINKMGGSSSCNFKRLIDYADLYLEYIKKEIEIIGPEVIVVLGKLPKGFPTKLCEFLEKYDIYNYTRHPSRYRKLKNNPKDLIEGDIQFLI